MERITQHIILPIEEKKKIKFTFEGRPLEGLEGEVISSALFANGIKVFSEHKKDGSPQGIFCANGQCAQCTVIADGLPVKACVAKVREGMALFPMKGSPKLPKAPCVTAFGRAEEVDVDALIIGGGPSGLAAAAELGKLNVGTLIIDDKNKLGGKLVLQTHKFFGSVEDCYAGTRGIDIADKLEDQLREYPSVKIWTNATAVAVFSDKKVGVMCGDKYFLVRPKALVSATGAREKSLAFPGNTLPGVYGAGAFQTLVNRDLVRPAQRLFIVGGGNVGLIAAYHALQAGIKVVGLIEALPHCGGYKVHADKIKRLGVPVYTRHTILQAAGKKELETVTIAKMDENFKPVPGTERTFKADTLLIAVGLNPVNEFHRTAVELGMNAFVCGDAEEIAEASAAMFSGKITAHRVLKSLGVMAGEVPQFWFERLEVLKSRPGETHKPALKNHESPVYPVLHCRQEIPCNPCVTVCPNRANVAYAVSPFEIRLQKAILENGTIKIIDDGIFKIEQQYQILNIEDFCNECGNCATFCPTAGAPYKNKPKVALTEKSFRNLKQGYFRQEGKIFYKDAHGIRSLEIIEDKFHFESEFISAKMTTDFSILEIHLKKEISGQWSTDEAVKMKLITDAILNSGI